MQESGRIGGTCGWWLVKPATERTAVSNWGRPAARTGGSILCIRRHVADLVVAVRPDVLASPIRLRNRCTSTTRRQRRSSPRRLRAPRRGASALMHLPLRLALRSARPLCRPPPLRRRVMARAVPRPPGRAWARVLGCARQSLSLGWSLLGLGWSLMGLPSLCKSRPPTHPLTLTSRTVTVPLNNDEVEAGTGAAGLRSSVG